MFGVMHELVSSYREKEMEEYYSRKDDEVCPQLLDLIPKEREWLIVKRDEENRTRHGFSEEKKLELRLGPPSEEYWTIKERWSCSGYKQVKNQQNQTRSPFLQFQSISTPQSLPVIIAKECLQPSCSKVVVDLQNAEKESFSQTPVSPNAMPNNSQKRSAPTPVVGWPPIRSFRKNLASNSSSKLSPSESQKVIPNKVSNEKPIETCRKGLFVKINMDGVPIGRKVDLKTYDCYEKLSSAVDELFRCLLAAQSDSSANGIDNKKEEEKPITSILDGSGEYTLVYEDNEGDRILVGDVPWNMFVSTVKRLRVLKSSELSTLCLGNKLEKLQ